MFQTTNQVAFLSITQPGCFRIAVRRGVKSVNLFGKFHQKKIYQLSMAGWWYTYPSEKYEFVNWDDYPQFQYMEKYKSCSKPPTR